ncbi:hypothetical protein C1645_736422 [Glomus cerebriforme]|uniref:Sacsin/Nov domain-containing protein n=1 Tax=Glomus cerebriforme TaxID=658196 RepID=A0A397TBP5_9GLOM|nr:hypothetical protein C1645_736422 [Glomus cerebriforme]
MTNTNNEPGANKRVRGREFRPREPYTHRLRRILEEYPDGSQILREILQNSDDAKSTEQIFILDHNTYQSNKLLEPDLVNYERANLKLDRYQGPALLAKNNTIFEKRDFQSLLKLADSEKQDQFDKIGVMGVGFNSIYHITDSPSFITGDKYVILDPHEWYFYGGVEFDLIEDRLAERYPGQFAPFSFRIPCDEPFDNSFTQPFKGTIFRYPLRDSTVSEISKKIYEPNEILIMFRRFYENEGINCLLFLKYIERISFYELKKGATEPVLIYKIELKNANEVRQKRRLIVENILPMMDSLNSERYDRINQLEASYVASFNRQNGDTEEDNSEWLIMNYLDDLLEAEKYFQNKFKKSIRDYKFIPNVGLAVPLNDLKAIGRLFCFLPIPIDMPFLVSVHGYFAVSTNRRSLWSPADHEDLAPDALANLKIEWNKYLFEKVLPKAWVKFLRDLPEVSDIRSNDIYKFWPRVGSDSSIISSFCKDLIRNIVENLDIEDRVFNGPSLSNGYLDRRFLDANLLKIIEKIKFPVISVPHDIMDTLKKSRHRNSLKFLDPDVIRSHLKSNSDRWEGSAIPREEVLQLFKYILSDHRFDKLEGLKIIPLADDTFGTLTLFSSTNFYIEEISNHNYSTERNSFINQLSSDKLIDKNIDPELYNLLYNNARDKWNRQNLNIKILDEIGVEDLMSIISDMYEDRELSINEINNVIEILKRIAKIQSDVRIDGNDSGSLDGLLIPSTDNYLVNIDEIFFDDMGDNLNNEERSSYKISHHNISIEIAEGLRMQTLKGKIFGNRDQYWEAYEQYESLTTRIKNILNVTFINFNYYTDYSVHSLFKEFLQNADDAGAKHFKVIVDERSIFQHKKMFSKELKVWQGPAIWIYNDAKFTEDDFQALLKLGIGGKSRDYEKIGKFGIGFNCAFNFTDLPSIVSGEHIAFLDPHGKFLPAQGYPSKKPRGTRINFKCSYCKKKCECERRERRWHFKRSFPDQCNPYNALLDCDIDCDFSKEFEGTLFRLPLRTYELARQSEISKQVPKISEILQLFNDVEGNKEMLFLRNIESCELIRMANRNPELIWKANIRNIDSYKHEHNVDDCEFYPCHTIRDYRREIIDSIEDAPTYKLYIERKNFLQNKKVSEVWAMCTGGHDEIRSEFEEENFSEEELENFAENKRLKPRGGVALLLAKYNKLFDELEDEPAPNFPNIKGELYSYLPLPISTNLGVQLNGNFSLPSARSGILQSEKDFLEADCDDTKWNRYILYNILPDLHVKLLDYIIELEKEKFEQVENYVPRSINNFWPIKNLSTGLYKSYGLAVIKRLGNVNHRIFWTEVDGGRFIPLEEAKIFRVEETKITNILVSSGISAVELDKNKIEQLSEIIESEADFPYKPVSGSSICNDLLMSSIPHFVEHGDNINYTFDSLFKLLEFILQDRSSFGFLKDLPLVPLSNGLVGKFGETYYVGKRKHLELFPNTGPSKFISTNLPENLQKIFNDNDFCMHTNIKKFDASAISFLLPSVLKPVKDFRWKPNENSLPNKSWLENIWSILNKGLESTDFNSLSRFPLLPVIKPSDMLIQPDANNPLLYIPENVHSCFPLFEVLVKLNVRITNMIFSESAHKDLKKCIVECTSTNIIDSLEKTRSTSPMKRWFEKNKLSPSDYEKFRTYIKEQLDDLIGK